MAEQSSSGRSDLVRQFAGYTFATHRRRILVRFLLYSDLAIYSCAVVPPAVHLVSAAVAHFTVELAIGRGTSGSRCRAELRGNSLLCICADPYRSRRDPGGNVRG